jgi:hypothetical protein
VETFVFNIAKGRVVEFFNRVDSNEPANSGIVVVPLKKGGTEAQGQDINDLKALLEDANFEEQTGGGWERKVLTDAQLEAIAVDDENNRFPASTPELEWSEPEAGNDLVGFLFCYDPNTTEGEDDTLIPLTGHAKTVTADGNDVILNAGEVFRAS